MLPLARGWGCEVCDGKCVIALSSDVTWWQRILCRTDVAAMAFRRACGGRNDACPCLWPTMSAEQASNLIADSNDI